MDKELGFVRPERIDYLLAGATIANIAVAWLTWVKVGASTRNSYEVFRSAQRFDLEVLDPIRFGWFFAPVVTLTCLVLLIIGKRRWAGVLGLIQSLFVSVISLVVLVIGVDIGFGPVLGLISGLCGVAIAAGTFMSSKSSTRI